ncbi:unnamed protein product [Cunninghamella echinulata]
MDMPLNTERVPIDEDPLYDETLNVLMNFDSLSEEETYKAFIKFTYPMYVNDYEKIKKLKVKMQATFANQLCPSVIRLIHSKFQPPVSKEELILYKIERSKLLVELLSGIGNKKFNKIFCRRVNRHDLWTEVGFDKDGGPSFVGVGGVSNNAL